MKILFVTNSLEPKDGWGRYGNDLIEEISRNHEVIVACAEEFNYSNLRQIKILHSPQSVSPFKIFFSTRKLQKIINSFDPDAIHFIVEFYVLMLPFLNLNKETRKVLTVHGTYSFIPFIFIREKIKLWFSGFLVKKAYEKINTIISVSSFTKLHLLNQYKDFYKEELSKNKITVVSNGINLNNFRTNINKKTKEKKSILFVGAVKKRKGIAESLDAIAEYKNNYNADFEYTIVGKADSEDLYVKEIKQKIKTLGLEKEVIITGKVSDEKLRTFYANADLFLMLPVKDGFLFEGFGLVYLEANVNGIPVIGSLNSGAEEAIMDGESGYLVNPFNPGDIAQKINSVLNDGVIKSEACIDWARKHDVREKAMIILNYYNK